MESQHATIISIINSKTDEQISQALLNKNAEINKFLLTQFAISSWKKQQQDKQEPQHNDLTTNDEISTFVNQLFESRERYFKHPQFFDGLLVHILSFVSNDDKLIHNSLVLINKQFNKVIDENYESQSFNYQPNFHQFLLKQNQLLNNLGKIHDVRLHDGYWVADVLTEKSFRLSSCKMFPLEFKCFGIPEADCKYGYELKDKYPYRNQVKRYYFNLKHLNPNNTGLFSHFASHGSMTKRPIKRYKKDKIDSLLNVNNFLGQVAVDVKICVDVCMPMYEKNDDHIVASSVELFIRHHNHWFQREWMCGIVDKNEKIASNGQICVLIDICNDEYFGKMTNDQFQSHMRESKYVNLVKKQIFNDRDDESQRNYVYFVKYWVHLDNHQEVSSFGTKSSLLQQEKLSKTLYSIHPCFIDDSTMKTQIVDQCVSQLQESFESLCYDNKYRLNSSNNPMIEMIDKYCDCDQCIHKHFCYKNGFVTQRPILLFDINQLFKTDFYNEKCDFKLMIKIKIKHLWIVDPNKNDHQLIDINKNNDTQDEWRQAQIIDIWQNSSNQERGDKKQMKQKFQKWKGQLKVGINVTDDIVKNAYDYQSIVMSTSAVSVIDAFDGDSQIFYNYFVHLDDFQRVKQL